MLFIKISPTITMMSYFIAKGYNPGSHIHCIFYVSSILLYLELFFNPPLTLMILRNLNITKKRHLKITGWLFCRIWHCLVLLLDSSSECHSSDSVSCFLHSIRWHFEMFCTITGNVNWLFKLYSLDFSTVNITFL